MEANQEKAGRSALIAASYREGPLPAADEFADYERVLPGAADRILRMAEAEQQHRHQMESDSTKVFSEDRQAQNAQFRRGQFFALLIGLLALLVPAIIAMLYDNPTATIVAGVVSVVLGGSGLVAVIRAFTGPRGQTSDSSSDTVTRS